MDNKDRILINTLLSSIDGQISAIRTILSVASNFEPETRHEPTPDKNLPSSQFTSPAEDAELEKMMGMPQFEENTAPQYLSVPEIPGTLMPAPGLVESKSVSGGMVSAMASAMNSIAADSATTEG